MADYVKIPVECPRCAAINNFPVFNFLQLDKGTKLRKAAISGVLFRFKCHDCGYTEQMDYPLISADDATDYIISVVPEDDDEAYDDACTILDASLEVSNCHCRIVYSTRQLSEKLRIAAYKLDDHIIEIVKAIVSDNFESGYVDQFGVPMAVDIVLEFRGTTGKSLRFAVIGDVDKDNIVEVPMSYYRKVSDKFKERRWRHIYVVDEKWAKEELMKKTEKKAAAK